MGKASRAEQAAAVESLAELRELLSAGDTVSLIMRQVSSSGTSRRMSARVGADLVSIDHHIVRLGIGGARWPRCDSYGYRPDGFSVPGAGMDMGFQVVYSLARTLWPEGHPCTGDPRCPSNEHTNGDRNYVAGRVHRDGGYGLKHRWL